MTRGLRRTNHTNSNFRLQVFLECIILTTVIRLQMLAGPVTGGFLARGPFFIWTNVGLEISKAERETTI